MAMSLLLLSVLRLPAIRRRLWIVILADHQPRRRHPVSLAMAARYPAVLQPVQLLSTLTPSVKLLDRLPLSSETAPLVVASILPGSENPFIRRWCYSVDTAPSMGYYFARCSDCVLLDRGILRGK